MAQEIEDGHEVPIPEAAAGQAQSSLAQSAFSGPNGCWVGAGLLSYGNARHMDTPGQRGYEGLSAGKWSGHG